MQVLVLGLSSVSNPILGQRFFCRLVGHSGGEDKSLKVGREINMRVCLVVVVVVKVDGLLEAVYLSVTR